MYGFIITSSCSSQTRIWFINWQYFIISNLHRSSNFIIHVHVQVNMLYLDLCPTKSCSIVIKLLPFSSFTSDGKQKFRSASLASWQSMGSKALGKKTSCWSSLILMQDSCLSNCTCMIYQGTSKDRLIRTLLTIFLGFYFFQGN